jgi:outer membrane protein assembly factor BamD (BamD/ComL family)
MKLIKTKSLIKTAVFLALLLTISCASEPASILEDLSTAELIQRAQEAADRNKYATSLLYYETLVERFPYDTDSVFAAEYEIAFIHYKQKKYDVAKTEFNDLLERYNTQDEALLPPQFKILSRIVLAKIKEQEGKKIGFFR